MPVYALA